jgi:hypothetical protein
MASVVVAIVVDIVGMGLVAVAWCIPLQSDTKYVQLSMPM